MVFTLKFLQYFNLNKIIILEFFKKQNEPRNIDIIYLKRKALSKKTLLTRHSGRASRRRAKNSSSLNCCSLWFEFCRSKITQLLEGEGTDIP